MKAIPWKKLAWGAAAVTAMIFVRAVVSLGRCHYQNSWRLPDIGEPNWLAQWKAVLLPVLQEDPWVYIGFGAAAVAIIAWAMIPGKPRTAPEENPEEPLA